MRTEKRNGRLTGLCHLAKTMLLLACWTWGAWSPLRAQHDYPYSVEQYSFVQYDQNKLLLPGKPDAFEPLFRKMDQLLFSGESQIQVVHIGGSHIQADMWSDRMRQRLQTFFPGARGTRGLLFPFKIAKTNNPYNYLPEYTGTWESCRNVQRNRDCSLGLTGISVTTRDPGATLHLSFRGDDYPQYEFNRARVFHDVGAGSFDIRVQNEGVRYTLAPRPGQGFTDILFEDYLTRLELEFVQGDSLQDHFTLYGVSLESNDPGFVYHAIGVNGAATSSYLRCALFPQHLKAIQPDLVVFSVGINDAYTTDFSPEQYERNYDELVAWVRQANPNACILFTTNNDSYYKRRYANKNAEKVRDVMMRLAQKHNAGVWDMYGVMGGLGSIKKWQNAGLANSDRIHLLKPGYELVADLMFNALMQAYDRHLQATYQNDH